MKQIGRLKVGIIFGGRSGEHEVSLMSTQSVLAELDAEQYSVYQIGIDHDGRWYTGDRTLAAMLEGDIKSLSRATLLPDPVNQGLFEIREDIKGEFIHQISGLDVVFPVLHGSYGEDGALQGLLELADISYVGAGVLGSALAMDKGVFKDIMRANNIPVPESIVVLRRDIEGQLDIVIQTAENLFPYPIFTKPANLGSSVGISKCQNRYDLQEGLFEAARYDRRILIERGINAREIEVSVLGNDSPEVSIPGEIIPSREYYSYEAKYIDGRSELLIPAPLPDEATQKIQELAIKAYKLIDCAGMARVDFLLEKDNQQLTQPGELYLSEINTIPGFTKISMYPKLWEASGITFPDLINRLIDLALERKLDKSRNEHRFQGVE